MIPSTGIGVKNTIDLKDTIKYALDTVPMLTILEVAFYAVIAVTVLSTVVRLIRRKDVNWKRTLTLRWRRFSPRTVCCFYGQWRWEWRLRSCGR